MDESTKYRHEATKLGDSMNEPTKYRYEATKLGGPMDEPAKNGTRKLN